MIPFKLNTKIPVAFFILIGSILVLSSASAEIKLTDNLSVSGFLDMSSVIEDDGEDTTIGLSFDQLELDFHLNYGSVTARVDIDSTGGFEHPSLAGVGQTQDVTLEQGYVTYTLPKDVLPGASITAGRFLSTFGFETAEPTGLYQFSFSEGIPYPAYQNGVAINLAPTKQFGIYAAVLSGVWDVNDTDLENPGFETQVSLMPVKQLTAKVGFAVDDTGGDENRSELNAWVQFSQGPLTLAGEIDLLNNWPSEENGLPVVRDSGIHFLGMANVSLADVISAPVGLTVRFSGIDLEDEETSTEITVSPSFNPVENWTLLAEFKRLIDKEVTQFAVKSLLTF
ncbi:MAG: outer membrane beta-barrel protein [Candidatus Poribacteria bacterium]|nr:outer membrane beta-barrel protein [Candidatus Poribacteria bacterium]